MTSMIEILCRDPVVARDGRPFGAGQGNRMRSLDWPLPSMLAGSLRTMLGKFADRDFSSEVAQELLQVEVAGPFPRAAGRLYLPAPEDCVVHPDKGPLRAEPRPLQAAGCDWPVACLQPVELTKEQTAEDFKPAEGPAWWPEDRYADWLTKKDVVLDGCFLLAAQKEDRTHVVIDSRSGASEESQLFTTTGLALAHLSRYIASTDGASSRSAPITLAARVRAEGWCKEAAAKLNALHPLGGERRLAHWSAVAIEDSWNCPQIVRGALAAAERVRMVLATPAIFKCGWKPGWLREENGGLVGMPPGAEVKLRLVGVSSRRWQAVSGWSLAALPNQPRGPKPVKRMVPAGGVYFFDVVDGKTADLAGRWLESVSDDEQDRRDGFGLAAWGVW